MLPPPEWVLYELTPFAASVKAAAGGDVARAKALLSSVRSDKLRGWYLEHLAFAGRARIRSISTGSAEPSAGPKLPQPGVRLQRFLLARDHYRCRYCGTPIISGSIMKDFGIAIGDDGFLTSFDYPKPGITVRHGAVYAFRATFDHVVPASRGGQTDKANLVSSCWFCNFGKRRWTLKQLGLQDPRDRPPVPFQSWNGLVDLSERLSTAARSI